jgi:hypothetical protein
VKVGATYDATMRRSALLLVLVSLLAAAVGAAAAARSGGGSPLDGRWTWTWTAADLSQFSAPRITGSFVAEFRDGRIYGNFPRPGAPLVFAGMFTVHGDLVSLRFRSSRTPGVVPGRTYVMRFSIFRDRLTWSMVRGRAGLDHLPATPWTRAG